LNTIHRNDLITGLTDAMTTQDGLTILKMVLKNQEVQYHIINDDPSAVVGKRLPTNKIKNRVGIDSLSTIYHDSVKELSNGRSVVIMAPLGTRIEDYANKASKMLKHFKKPWSVSEIYQTTGLDNQRNDAFKIDEQSISGFEYLKKLVRLKEEELI